MLIDDVSIIGTKLKVKKLCFINDKKQKKIIFIIFMGFI